MIEYTINKNFPISLSNTMNCIKVSCKPKTHFSQTRHKTNLGLFHVKTSSVDYTPLCTNRNTSASDYKSETRQFGLRSTSWVKRRPLKIRSAQMSYRESKETNSANGISMERERVKFKDLFLPCIPNVHASDLAKTSGKLLVLKSKYGLDIKLLMKAKIFRHVDDSREKHNELTKRRSAKSKWYDIRERSVFIRNCENNNNKFTTRIRLPLAFKDVWKLRSNSRINLPKAISY